MSTSVARPIRIVTAAALFDGHDAAINLMRRLLQDAGVEVIHLGHNRSASDVVDAAIQEDAHALAVSWVANRNVLLRPSNQIQTKELINGLI